MTQVFHSPRARQDLAEIWHYIAQGNVTAADGLAERFDSTFFMLSQSPRAGRIRDDIAAAVRTFPVGRYLIIYRQIEGGVEIMRVVHGARDLRTLPLQ